MNIRDGGPIVKVINEAIRKQERDAKTRKQNEKRLRTKKTAESGERLIHLVVHSECIKIAKRCQKRN